VICGVGQRAGAFKSGQKRKEDATRKDVPRRILIVLFRYRKVGDKKALAQQGPDWSHRSQQKKKGRMKDIRTRLKKKRKEKKRLKKPHPGEGQDGNPEEKYRTICRGQAGGKGCEYRL